MLLKLDAVSQGLHPNEFIVKLNNENLVVHRRSLSGQDQLRIGYPVDERDNEYLVELPQETTSGAWRIWVSKDKVTTGANP